MKQHKNELEQIVNFLFETMGKASVYFVFGLWVKKKHPELFQEFLNESEGKKEEGKQK